MFSDRILSLSELTATVEDEEYLTDLQNDEQCECIIPSNTDESTDS